MTKQILTLISALLVIFSAVAQNDNEKESPFTFNASYIGDFVGNAGGGVKDGAGYLGYGSLGVTFSTGAAGWWKGGEFVLSGGSTHGATPAVTLIGDYQGADNIEAGDYFMLQSLYYSQTLGNVQITGGLLDFYSLHAYTDAAQLYINSSFGINSLLAYSYGIAIFPMTAWALDVEWDITDWLKWQTGVFDVPYGFDDNPYNIRWAFTKEKGAVAVSEFVFGTSFGDGLEGSYRLGAIYQTAMECYELHAAIEQMFWKGRSRSLTAFAMTAYEPQKINENYANFAAGINLNGVFSKKGNDAMGLGFTTALFDNEYEQETAIELTYKYTFSERFYLQPDLQYIINPAGMEYTGEKGKNTLFMALRFGIEF